MTQQELVRELHSESCRCGKTKRPGLTFCYRCFEVLPLSLKKALYSKMGAGYEEAREQSVECLDAVRALRRAVA